MSTFGQIGQVENNSLLQGRIKTALVGGITTSTWNPRTGGTSKTVFRGTQTQVTALAKDCQTAGYEYSISGGHIWTLEVTFPVDIIINSINSEPRPIVNWELSYQPFEKNILELGDRLFISNLSTKTKQHIEEKLRNPNVDSTTTPWAAGDEANWLEATIAYTLKRIGTEGKQGWVHTLKKTMVINTYTTNPPVLTNQYNGKLFLKQELKQTYSDIESNSLSRIPDIIYNNMPSTLNVLYYPGNIPMDYSGYVLDKNGIVTFIGWLEYPPEYQMISLQKCQISTHWVFNQWSAGPYGLYDIARSTETPPDPKIALGSRSGMG